MYELVFRFNPSPAMTESERDSAARRWRQDVERMLTQGGVEEIEASLFKIETKRTAMLHIV